MLEDLPLELAQPRPRIEPQLAGEPLPGRGEDRQRIGVPSRSIESEHQLPDQALSQRVLAHELLELWHETRALAACEVGVDPLLDSEQTALFELLDRTRGDRLVLQVRQCRAAPDRERVAQDLRRLARVSARAELARLLYERLEAVEIELARLDTQQVPRRLADDALGAQQGPKARDVAVERSARRVGRTLAPDRFYQSVARDGLVGMQQQHRQHGALLRPA